MTIRGLLVDRRRRLAIHLLRLHLRAQHAPSDSAYPLPLPVWSKIENDTRSPQERSALTNPGGSSTSEIHSTSVSPQPTKRQKVVAEDKNDVDAPVVAGDVVDEYLGGLVPLAINPSITETLFFSREGMHERFGGNRIRFITKFQRSSLCGRAVMFPTPERNPYTPGRPGDPGVFFSVAPEVIPVSYWGRGRFGRSDRGALAVFSSQIQQGDQVWTYLGQYLWQDAGTLTPQLFAAQCPEFRRAWGKRIVTGKKAAIREMRARIALRKEGEPITELSVWSKLLETCLKDRIDISVDDAIQALKVWHASGNQRHAVDLLVIRPRVCGSPAFCAGGMGGVVGRARRAACGGGGAACEVGGVVCEVGGVAGRSGCLGWRRR
ncbi:hypothetical protein C8R43DRAFT_598530 [Mycena crocata]|nr:hypothetical protein C8R43DRAFT_598530 [Mycena crocata]